MSAQRRIHLFLIRCRTARLLYNPDNSQLYTFGKPHLKFFIYIFRYVLGRGVVLLKIADSLQRLITKAGNYFIDQCLEFLEVHHHSNIIELFAADLGDNHPVVIVNRFLRTIGQYQLMRSPKASFYADNKHFKHKPEYPAGFYFLRRCFKRSWTLFGIKFDRSPPNEAISRIRVELVKPYCSLVIIKTVSIPATARLVMASWNSY
jgi:hypothetical protein